MRGFWGKGQGSRSQVKKDDVPNSKEKNTLVCMGNSDILLMQTEQIIIILLQVSTGNFECPIDKNMCCGTLTVQRCGISVYVVEYYFNCIRIVIILHATFV